jgi:hypothetical protein
MFSKPRYLEVVPTGVGKGEALVELARLLGIPVSETIAIGDSLNDLSMIQMAGTGVAVANARAEVKAVAEFVTHRSASEGAVAEVCDRFFSSADSPHS